MKVIWKDWKIRCDGKCCDGNFCREGIDENETVWIADWKNDNVEGNEYPELYVYSVKNSTGINISINNPFCPTNRDEAWKR